MDSTSAVDSATLAFNLGPLLTTITTNTLWAWLAVVTAAFSFWRLRSTTPTTLKPDPTLSHVEAREEVVSDDCDLKQYPVVVEEKEEEGVLTRGSSMKERLFNAYYDDHVQEEEECHVSDEDDVDGEDEMLVMGLTSTVEMKGTGELGWYRYQDRNVIDGSVVRLWDEKNEGSCCNSPRSCRRRLIMVEVKQPLIFV